MKKTLTILLGVIFLLTGCSNSTEAETQSSDLMEVESIQRPMTAVSVADVKSYDFAISDDLVEGIDTFTNSETLSIKFNNFDDYKIYYSDDQEFTEDEVLVEISSTDSANYEGVANQGFYRLTSTNEDIDAVVAVN